MMKNCQKILLFLVIFFISISFLTGCFDEIVETRKRIYFPSQTEGSRSPLEFQTLMGTGNFEKIMPTETGVYLYGPAKLYDFNPSFDGSFDDMILVRTDRNGKYLWGKMLDHDNGQRTGGAVVTYIGNLITDTDENLYISGFTERFEIFGHLVPINKPSFIACITKEGYFRWISFFKDDFNREAKLTLYNNCLYYCFVTNVYIPSEDKDNPGEDTFTSLWLDPETGKIIRNKKTECYTEFRWYDISPNSNGWYILQQSKDDVVVHSFSFDGTLQWKNVYNTSNKDISLWFADKVSSKIVSKDQPVSIGSRREETRELDLIAVSNSTQLFLIGGFVTDKEDTTTDEGNIVREYKNFVLAISFDGKKLWGDKSSIEFKGILVKALCNENNLFLVGKASTEFLPKSKNTYQPKITGKDDLFIQAISMNGETQWSTYLGGHEDEPGYYFDEYSQRDSFYNIACDLNEEYFAIISSSTSNDFPVINANPRFTNPMLYNQSSFNKDRKPQTLGVLSVFDLNGKIIWSTYYTTDATDEQIKNTQKSDFVTKQEQDEPLAQCIKIYQDRVYSISKTSNNHTLLFQPEKNWVSVSEYDAKPDFTLFVNLFSAFKLK